MIKDAILDGVIHNDRAEAWNLMLAAGRRPVRKLGIQETRVGREEMSRQLEQWAIVQRYRDMTTTSPSVIIFSFASRKHLPLLLPAAPLSPCVSTVSAY